MHIRNGQTNTYMPVEDDLYLASWGRGRGVISHIISVHSPVWKHSFIDLYFTRVFFTIFLGCSGKLLAKQDEKKELSTRISLYISYELKVAGLFVTLW